MEWMDLAQIIVHTDMATTRIRHPEALRQRERFHGQDDCMHERKLEVLP